MFHPVAAQDQHGEFGQVVAGEVVQLAAGQHLPHRRQPVAVEPRAVADAHRPFAEADFSGAPSKATATVNPPRVTNQPVGYPFLAQPTCASAGARRPGGVPRATEVRRLICPKRPSALALPTSGGYPDPTCQRQLVARQQSRGDLSSWLCPNAGCRVRTPAVGVRSGRRPSPARHRVRGRPSAQGPASAPQGRAPGPDRSRQALVGHPCRLRRRALSRI